MNYHELNQSLAALIKDVPYTISNLANAAALLFGALDTINWAGFYILRGNSLILGPFQGKPACIEIPMGRGVCGTAAQLDQTQVVSDVHKFPGHIACDAASRSEIVIPLHCNGKIIGVLDIDSPILDRFSQEDLVGLEKFAEILEEAIEKSEKDGAS